MGPTRIPARGTETPRLAVTATGRLLADRQLAILESLQRAPLTRYRLARTQGVRRNEVIYRAVDVLTAIGLVERVEIAGSPYPHYRLTPAGIAEIAYWKGNR